MPPGQIFSLIVVVLFIFGLFYLRAYILKKASGRSWGRLGTKNIIILEQFAIARDKTFCLVEVAGKVYLVALTNHTATLLDTYDAADIEEAAAMRLDKNNTETSNRWEGIPTGNSPYARMTRRLARFFAARMGKSDEFKKQLAKAIEEDKAKRG